MTMIIVIIILIEIIIIIRIITIITITVIIIMIITIIVMIMMMIIMASVHDRIFIPRYFESLGPRSNLLYHILCSSENWVVGQF